jgi:surfactin synthase thioesterase subunit
MTKNRIQLFTLHFSGGNCYSFQFLRPHLPSEFDFHPLELPGRGKRIKEDLLTSEPEAVNDIVAQILTLRNKQPFLIFGHSMGACLGLKVTKRLEELNDPPLQLVVAGNAGPGISGVVKRRSAMNDADFKEELRALGGVPEEVLKNDDLFNFFAPVIRCDFRIIEKGEQLPSGFKIKSPITAIMGSQEETSDKITNWKNFTSSEFSFYHLPGNHFFIYDHPVTLIQIMKNCYDRSVVS